ncbi:MAG TPA: phasin family protein [Burkholderiales bacterium]|nr:phasin family protein [Burkholderiales bacterium]
MAGANEQFFENWKRQVDTCLKLMDAVVEASAKMRAAQLAAAQETHRRVAELEKAVAEAGSAQEVCSAQWDWTLATCERSAAYWRSLFEAMAEANGRMARCAQDGVQVASAGQAGEVPATGFEAVDNIYREMLKTSQRLLEYTTGAGTEQPKKAA